jgi:hypothetical protein
MASPLIIHVVFDKLTRANHVVWKAQVKVVVCSARLLGHLNSDAKAPPHEITIKFDDKDGKESSVPNPTYEAWEVVDQRVLSYILSSLSKEVLIQIDQHYSVKGPNWLEERG